MFVADEDGKVAYYKHGRALLEGYLTRCTLAVRALAVSADGRTLAVSSDELAIKLIDVREPVETRVRELTGAHAHPATHLAFAPDGSTLLSSSPQDGSVRVWDLRKDACVRTLDGLVDAKSGAIAWHPSGSSFVVATKLNDVAAYSATAFERVHSFDAPELSSSASTTAVAFSPNGLYLATTSSRATDAEDRTTVALWDTATRTIVAQAKHARLATALEFCPMSPDDAEDAGSSIKNMLAWTTEQGELVRWNDCLPAGRKPFVSALPAEKLFLDDMASVSSDDDEGPPPRAAQHSDDVRDMVDDGDDDDVIDDPTDTGRDLDGWLDDDLGVTRKKPKQAAAAAKVAPAPPAPKIRAFQPGATPWRQDRRYLAFNALGFISAVERDESNLVTIEFHDRTRRANSHFTDHFKHSLAALGALGSVFACEARNDSPSVVYYRPYDSWTTSREWQVNLPPGENATAVAVGGVGSSDDDDDELDGAGTVVVATDRSFVRFLSGSGIQRYVWHWPGKVVAVAAHGDLAIVIGATSFTLIDIETFEVLQHGELPTADKLAWVGFSTDGIPALYDGALISLLDRARRPRQGRWVPVLDTAALERSRTHGDRFWPFALTSTHVSALVLKGKEQHPGFPTPIPHELDLRLPFMKLDEQQGELEEKYARESMMTANRRDGAPADDYAFKSALAREELETDKCLLKIIQSACKSERLHAAFDAALMLSQPGSLDAAAKIAHFFSLPTLVERIELIKDSKMGLRRWEEDNKRDVKWQHLVDDRTVVNSRSLFSAPLGSAPSSSVPAPSAPSVRGFSEAPATAHSATAAYSATEEPSWIQHTSDDVSMSSEAHLPPPPARKPVNPFAKRASDAPPAPSNPFKASEQPTGDLKRSDSFFQRVENPAPRKHKQSTLFGLPPGESASRAKRKSDDNNAPPSKVRKSSALAETQDRYAGQLSVFLHHR